METYSDYVRALVAAVDEARGLPLGGESPLALPPVAAGTPVALLCSPHPDDEVITGALPLRLRQQAGWRVLNLALTLGRDPGRQRVRAAEMAAGCRHLGFDSQVMGEHGLGTVTAAARREDPAGWSANADAVAAVIADLRPAVVFVPHEADGHPAHIGSHHLVVDALRRLPGLIGHLVETEYWHPLESPNLMVESTPDQVAALLAALSHHVGEVRRNPYHLTLPLWMADNVRRGSERVGGHGAAAAAYRFASLYRVRPIRDGRVEPAMAPRQLDAGDGPAGIFRPSAL